MRRTSNYLSVILAAGLLASGLFLLVLGAELGFLFLFTSTLPLFYLGLGSHPRPALYASLLAGLVIGIIGGTPLAIIFLLFLGLPAWAIAQLALSWHEGEELRLWFPMGWIMAYLACYGCAMLSVITWFYAMQPGGLPHLLAQNIHHALAELEDEYGEVINILANQWAFLIFPVTIWMWGIALYFHAWLANWLLAKRHAAIRPDISIHLFPMPNWVLSLMGIAGLASVIGGDSMRFLGNGVIVVLLLPYFFLGAAIVNYRSHHWPNRQIILFLLYFVVLSLLWPALAFSGIGLWHHIKSLNKRLSSGGSSFKS